MTSPIPLRWDSTTSGRPRIRQVPHGNSAKKPPLRGPRAGMAYRCLSPQGSHCLSWDPRRRLGNYLGKGWGAGTAFFPQPVPCLPGAEQGWGRRSPGPVGGSGEGDTRCEAPSLPCPAGTYTSNKYLWTTSRTPGTVPVPSNPSAKMTGYHQPGVAWLQEFRVSRSPLGTLHPLSAQPHPAPLAA